MLPLFTRLEYIVYLSFLISTAVAQGQIAQFLDFNCDQGSPINPSVSLPLDTCLVTSGAQGVVVQVYPRCPSGSGNTTLQLYKDTLCASPDTFDGFDTDCYWFGGSGIPALMFLCGSVAEGDSHATSTSTVTAGSVLVPVAKATGDTTSPTSDSLSSQTATDSNGLVASATPTSSASNPSQTSASSTDGGSSSGLSQHQQIILGIALPVGSIIVALLAWQCPKPWNSGGRHGQHDDYQMFPVEHHMPRWHRG